jgi:integrase
VRLLIATGQRREEVSGLNWSELSRGERMWTLPKERSKNAVSHTIPLNQMAMRVLDTVAGGEIWPITDLVFATSGKKRFIGHSKGKQKIDSVLASDGGPTIAPWRLHDLRRTAATNLQRLGVRFEVTEAVLNHLSGSKAGVAATYQKHTWASEKREALELWSRKIEAITDRQQGATDAAQASPSQIAFHVGFELGVAIGRLAPSPDSKA